MRTFSWWLKKRPRTFDEAALGPQAPTFAPGLTMADVEQAMKAPVWEALRREGLSRG